MNRTRRALLQLFAAALARAAAPLAIDALRDPAAPHVTRAYRADVLISVLGVHLYSKQGAGSAVASISESAGRTALCFSGGSHPEKVHGVRYEGSTEEIALESGGELQQAASFGFVTASPSDESLDQARHRISEKRHDTFVAVEESHEPARILLRKAILEAPIAEVRAKFAEMGPPDKILPAAGVAPMFLHTVLRAIRGAAFTSAEYRHNGKRYRLETARAGDRLTGRIHDFETAKNSEFRLCIEEGSDLPRRIEFSPRSYLHITLEAL